MATARHNAEIAALRCRLVGTGKKQKVAVVAVMRKLAVVANALLRDGREWQDRRPTSARGTLQ